MQKKMSKRLFSEAFDGEDQNNFFTESTPSFASPASAAFVGISNPMSSNVPSTMQSEGVPTFSPYYTKRYRSKRGRARYFGRMAWRLARAQSWKDYGAMRVKRGTDENIARFGATRATATPMQLYNRDSLGYTGRGFYKGFGGDVGEWIGSKVGLGGLGRALGTAGAKYTGFGAYVTNDTVGAGSGSGSGIPSFSPQTDTAGNVMISYREYVCDVYGPTESFGNNDFPINPGIEGTFPYLSQLAQNYEEFTIHQLMFTFKSSIAPIGASGSGQVGEIIMGTNYNPSQQPWTDKQTMLQNALSMTGRASEDQIHGVECDPSKLSGSVGKYVRAGPVDDDLKDYDHGLFQLAVSGIPTAYQNQPIGQLWVSYTVELRKPRKFVSAGNGISRDVFAISSMSPLGGTTAGDLFGLSAAMPKILGGINNSIGIEPAWSGSNQTQFTLPDNFVGKLKARIVIQQTNPANACSWDLILSPNISLIHDTVAGGSFNDWFGVQGVSGIPVTMLEWHMNVSSVGTSGAPNVFYIKLLTGNASESVARVQLDVEEYNTTFNTDKNFLALQDVNGNKVTLTS